ncbi:MAG TPA: peptidylprolyl isomerase [Opitutaceae bacterium]|nr:peptidylprolyl isomerase [Opitutaceae bacterium]
MKRPPASLLVGLALVFALALGRADEAALPDGLYAEFSTPRGNFVAELFYTKAPLMCVNFTGLAEGTLAPRDGHPFYSGLTWYRVVPGFVIQSGNPGLKDTDDEANPIPHRFPDEFVPGLHHEAAGVLSMANAGPDTNSCEFFVTLAPTRRLDYLHSVFGRIVRGEDVLARIRQDDAVAIKILRIGAAARAFRADAVAFAALRAKAKTFSSVASASALPGPAAHFDDPDRLLPVDPPRAKNFNFKLANFERATGLKIVARLLARSPPNTDGRKLGTYAHELATKLDVEKTGALALYVADRDEWKLWIGDDSAAAFMGHAGTVKDFMQGGAFHEAKQGLLDAARATGEADFAAQQKSAAGPSLPTGQRLKLQTDAVLDGLIARLEPR